MLTREMLASVLTFDESKGRFYWLGTGRGKPVGKEAGSFDAHGYGQINVFGKVWKEHRLVWLWMHGELPPCQLDHVNHDRRDNRPENLRLADNIENHKNRPMQNSNKSGYIGVWHDKKRGHFQAYINVNRKRINLGQFKTLEQAIEARRSANLKYGFHENHGSDYGRPKHKKLKVMADALGIPSPPGQWTKDEVRAIRDAYRVKANQLSKELQA
jgi:hypothetical protein